MYFGEKITCTVYRNSMCLTVFKVDFAWKITCTVHGNSMNVVGKWVKSWAETFGRMCIEWICIMRQNSRLNAHGEYREFPSSIYWFCVLVSVPFDLIMHGNLMWTTWKLTVEKFSKLCHPLWIFGIQNTRIWFSLMGILH